MCSQKSRSSVTSIAVIDSPSRLERPIPIRSNLVKISPIRPRALGCGPSGGAKVDLPHHRPGEDQFCRQRSPRRQQVPAGARRGRASHPWSGDPWRPIRAMRSGRCRRSPRRTDRVRWRTRGHRCGVRGRGDRAERAAEHGLLPGQEVGAGSPGDTAPGGRDIGGRAGEAASAIGGRALPAT